MSHLFLVSQLWLYLGNSQVSVYRTIGPLVIRGVIMRLQCTYRRNKMSHVMRKPAFCICENKDTDQLRGNREADQRLCFRYTYRTIPLLAKSEISSL